MHAINKSNSKEGYLDKKMATSKNNFSKFLVLWSGELISAIGGGISAFGLGVYVFNMTGKASDTALVTLLAFLPCLLLSAPAGVLADRYDRRLMMILGDSLSALGLVYILICMLIGQGTLTQICIGVTISSVFSSLLEPSYKATVTDLLTKDEYSKASGLVQAAGSARYLISPAIAGALLVYYDIKLLLIIDICTFFVTVVATLIVRSNLASKVEQKRESFLREFKIGWKALNARKGVMTLVVITSVITLFIGFIQVLSTPMMLGFTTSGVLGAVETISASGILVASVAIGFLSLKSKLVRILSASLFCAGIFMMLFGFRENVYIICIAGFLFFAMLPFGNTCLDVLIRSNIDNEFQGRAWGLIGMISQIGYVISYAISGVLADKVFTPLLVKNGLLASSIGKIIGTGQGRGTGFLIIVAGMFLCISAIILGLNKSVKSLEKKRV